MEEQLKEIQEWIKKFKDFYNEYENIRNGSENLNIQMAGAYLNFAIEYLEKRETEIVMKSYKKEQGEK